MTWFTVALTGSFNHENNKSAAFTVVCAPVTGYSYGHSYKQTLVNSDAIKDLVKIVVKYLEFLVVRSC